jgi:phosphoglycolate phosphatase
MVDTAVAILGCDRDALLHDFRRIHQASGDSEHPYSLLETDIVRRAFPNKDRSQVAAILDEAFHTFNRERKKRLKLYDGVSDSLERLVDYGIHIVGHTESRPLAVRDRIYRLGLSKYFKRVYCRERATSHSGVEIVHPETDLVELSRHQAKPAPAVLREICAREGIEPSKTAYVGDSLFKDVSMANAAGVAAAWAKYGTQVLAHDYERLVAVSHWSDEDVQRARAFSMGAVPAQPDFVLERGFDELLPVFGLEAGPQRASA